MPRSIESIRERHEANRRFWSDHPTKMSNCETDIDTLLAEVERLRALRDEVVADWVDQGDAMGDAIADLRAELLAVQARERAKHQRLDDAYYAMVAGNTANQPVQRSIVHNWLHPLLVITDGFDTLKADLATARAEGFRAGSITMLQRCVQAVKDEADRMGYRSSDDAISAINSLLIISEDDTKALAILIGKWPCEEGHQVVGAEGDG